MVIRPALACLSDPVPATDAEVARWLVARGLLEAPAPAPRGVAADFARLREAIAAVLRAVVAGDPVDRAAVTEVDDWLVLAGTRPALAVGDDGTPVLGERASDSPRRALGALALDAAHLLGDPQERARLRVCEGCGEIFHDRSPAARRRWCSMTTCGNRAKARRHRERRAT